jgi:Spy/CpxP family protein refolding chaperone
MIIVLAISFSSVLVGCSNDTSPERVPPEGVERNGDVTDESSEEDRELLWWRDESVLAALQLTDDQLQAVTELMSLARQEGNRQRQTERRMSISYLRALAQEPYDEILVTRSSEQLIEVLSERSRNRIETIRAVREILTQDQWSKLWEIAPRALQIGSFRIVRGPALTTEEPTPTPTPPF